MKLQHVEIFDFKSIINENINIQSNQLCIVGKNECGKSSLIKSISYLNPFDYELTSNLLNKHSKIYPNGLPTIIGLFKISKKSYSFLLKLLVENISEEIISKLPKQSENSFLQLKRWGNGISNISISITDNTSYGIKISDHIDSKAKFYNDFFETIYPTIEYFENEELLIEPATINELLGKDRKFETFRRLLYIGGCSDLNILNNSDDNFIATYLSQIEDKFNEILKKHYKQDESISIRLQTIRGDKLNLIIRDSTKLSFSIDERSPGFQYYFSFLINKLYSKFINGDKNTILLLDEPGGSLHPKGSKDLLKSFDDISEKSQILYTTHNPFLAVRNCIDSLIFVSKSPKEGTKINKKPFLNKYQILRKELGILLNDSFLIGDINLVVEGNTEKLAFHRIFQIEKYRELEWINIYNADGVANIPQAINYLGKNNLKLSGITILDSDNEANKIKSSKSFKDNIKEGNWESIEINDVFNDTKTRTFEDLFPQEMYINAFNKYCISLKNLEVFQEKYENFKFVEKIELPLIDTLNLHFKSFLLEGSKSNITKQDVMRYFLDDLDLLAKEEQDKALEIVFKLVDKIKIANKKIEKYVNN